MNLGKITLITPPDKLFNTSLSYLLVKPSNYVKEQFQTILSQIVDDINVYVFDNDDTDIGWLLATSLQVDLIIIDVDNCDPMTHKFLSFMMAQPNVHYITKDESTPFHLINRNRIYDLDWIVERIKAEEEGRDDDTEEE
jgi:hypothetical protein